MSEIGERGRRLLAVTATVAIICNVLAAFVVAYASVFLSGLACETGCSPTSSDWSEHPGSWQWDVVVSLSLATIVAALLLLAVTAIMLARVGARRRTSSLVTTLVTIPPLAVEIAGISGVLVLLAQTDRSDLRNQVSWLAVFLIATGSAAVWSVLRARAR